MKRPLDGVPVLVTRPAGRANALLEGLRAAGALAYHQPLLRIVPLHPEQDAAQLAAGRERILDLDRYARVICVSVNAVQHGLDWMAQYWPQWPLGQRWYGVGAATAAALRDWGLVATQPGGSMTSEALLALPELADVQGERILIVRGIGGRNELARVLQARGAQVDYLECYRRAPADLTGGELCQLLRERAIAAVCLNSGETLVHYQALLREGGCIEAGGAPLLVLPAQRLLQQAREMGFDRVTLAENASDAATIAALERWFAGASG